jgi:hypothetical protein
MTFCGAMKHSGKLVLRKKLLHQGHIGDISLYKGIIWGIFNIPQIAEVAGIGERVKIYNLVMGIFRYK